MRMPGWMGRRVGYDPLSIMWLCHTEHHNGILTMASLTMASLTIASLTRTLGPLAPWAPLQVVLIAVTLIWRVAPAASHSRAVPAPWPPPA